jgi:hypothetical protein
MASVQHFTIRWGDTTYHTQDLSGVELVALEDKIGHWYQWNAYRANDCAWLLATFLKKDGRSDAEVEKIMESDVLPALTIDFLGSHVEAVKADLPSMYEDGLPDPKAEGGDFSTGG